MFAITYILIYSNFIIKFCNKNHQFKERILKIQRNLINQHSHFITFMYLAAKSN